MKNKLFLSLIAVLGLVSCTNPKNSSNNALGLSTTLKLNWTFTGSFAPEALAALEYAPKNNLELRLEEGGQGKDPLKFVRDNEFGAASADEILRANDKGTNFVIIGVINYNSPACFLSLASDSIHSPKDFANKTVGLLPFGSTGLIYKVLKKKNGITDLKISEITVSPDLKVFLLGKTHQVHPAFIFDETVSLDLEGVDYNVIEPRNFGVAFKGPCYFTTAKTIRENPILVQTFINSIAAGMNAAIANPEDAINALKRLSPSLKEERELLVWKKAIEYYKGYNNLPLTSDMESWSEMVDELIAFKELSEEPLLGNVLNFTFINNYYKQ